MKLYITNNVHKQVMKIINKYNSIKTKSYGFLRKLGPLKSRTFALNCANVMYRLTSEQSGED